MDASRRRVAPPGLVRLMGFVFVASLLTPRIAMAHTHLTKSEPAAQARLAKLPTLLRFWFSEAPELALTRISLVGPDSKKVDLAAVERDESKLAFHVRITGPLVAGTYHVIWKTAASDGHPASGSFTFTILPSAVAHGASTPSQMVLADEEPTAETPGYIAWRAVGFAALLGLIGTIAFRVLVLPRTTLGAEQRRSVANLVARIGLVAAGALLLSALGRLYAQAAMMAGPGDTVTGMMSVTVTATSWGRAWIAQVALAIVALLAFVVAARGRAIGWWIAACSALLISVTPAFGGHAAASDRLPALAIAADALHVLAASAWLGSLFCVFLAAALVSTAQTTGGRTSRWTDVSSLVGAFSPTALVSAALVGLTGVVSSWLRLGSLSALWTSTYGRVLLVKLAALTGVAGTGAFNWLRVRPVLETESGMRLFRRTASAELMIAGLVILVTAILVAAPTPGDLA